MLDLKALLAKILTALFGLVVSSGSYQLANSTVMTVNTAQMHYIKLPDGHYLVAFVFGIKTTQTRTDLAAVRIVVNRHVLGFTDPYFFMSVVSGSWRNSYGNNQGYWLNAAGTWTANTEYRVSGVAIMYDTGDTI